MFRLFDGCEVASPNWIDCNYLPSINGDIYCFYKPISCSNPPTVDHATLSTDYERRSKYSLFDTVEFTCDEGFEMIGHSIINCNHSGQWSIPPQCFLTNTSTASAEIILEPTTTVETTQFKELTKTTKRPFFPSPGFKFTFIRTTVFTKPTTTTIVYSLVIVLPISLFLLATLFLVVAVRYKIKLKAAKKLDLQKELVEDDNILSDLKQIDEPLLPLRRKQNSVISLIDTAPTKRNREFDAFVLYCFDTDDDFVINHLLTKIRGSKRF